MNTLEALLHICIYIYTHVYSTEMTHTSFLCACWKTGSAVTYKQHHTHVNTWMFENMQKFTVFAILPEGFVQSGKIVYRSSVCVCVCVGMVNSELDLGRISPANTFCFSNRMVQRNGWSLLNPDGADGVSRAASWRENGIQIFSRGCVSFSVDHFAVLMWHTPPVRLTRALSRVEKHLDIWPGSDSWRRNPLKAITRVWLSTVWNISIYHWDVCGGSWVLIANELYVVQAGRRAKQPVNS